MWAHCFQSMNVCAGTTAAVFVGNHVVNSDDKNACLGVEDHWRRGRCVFESKREAECLNQTSVCIQLYLDDCCCLMLRDGRCFHLCFLVSAVTCGKIPGVPTFLSAFPPPLLNHNCCRAAPVNTHTKSDVLSMYVWVSQFETYSWADIWRAELWRPQLRPEPPRMWKIYC